MPPFGPANGQFGSNWRGSGPPSFARLRACFEWQAKRAGKQAKDVHRSGVASVLAAKVDWRAAAKSGPAIRWPGCCELTTAGIARELLAPGLTPIRRLR